jgi:hypothetical protein
VSVATLNITIESEEFKGLLAMQIIGYDGNIVLLLEGSFF